MTDEKEGPIGYRRPPRHTQFKPGQSGNPRGHSRAAGSSTTGAVSHEFVNEADRAKAEHMRAFEIFLRKLVHRALNDNDFCAVKEVLALCEKYKVMKPPPA
jgi:hypothetical protein